MTAEGKTSAQGFFPPLSAYLDPDGGPDTLRQRVIDQLDLLTLLWVPKSKLVLVGIETGDGNLTFLRCMPVHGLPRLT